mgnify:CR=1 FL=1
MDDYATHLPLLVHAVMVTSGPVLEMGCGDYSTPILNRITQTQNRRLVTCEYDAKWLSNFLHLQNSKHELYHVTDWASFKLIDECFWDVIFVDHSPGERRVHDLIRLANKAKFIILHDTEIPNGGYGYEAAYPLFKYIYKDTNRNRFRPHTSVLSNFHDTSIFEV